MAGESQNERTIDTYLSVFFFFCPPKRPSPARPRRTSQAPPARAASEAKPGPRGPRGPIIPHGGVRWCPRGNRQCEKKKSTHPRWRCHAAPRSRPVERRCLDSSMTDRGSQPPTTTADHHHGSRFLPHHPDISFRHPSINYFDEGFLH